jgi:type VI secretion system secreted protein VgrG
VRVSQAWAGAGWGAQHVPRIGQEVIVEFLDGDLDRPIVTGRVYNNVTKPPYDPRDHASQSGFKSQTVGGSADQYNELRFEDRKGEEEILMRAQRDLITRVRHDSQGTIGHDHKHTVKNNLNLKVSEGEYTTEVEKGRMYVHVPEAEFHVVSKLITEDAEDSIELMVHGCRLFIDKTKIELTASGNTITLGPDGITIKGTMVRIN